MDTKTLILLGATGPVFAEPGDTVVVLIQRADSAGRLITTRVAECDPAHWQTIVTHTANVVLDEASSAAVTAEIEVKEQDGSAPAVFIDAPRATDADAATAAPTITRSFLKKTLHLDAATAAQFLGNLPQEPLPTWCTEANLSANTEERGSLLTYTLKGEKDSRVVWVRA